jgi:predicted XRE-type DNA-binding protein
LPPGLASGCRESDDDVFAQVGPHVKDVHGIDATLELREQLAPLVHDA